MKKITNSGLENGNMGKICLCGYYGMRDSANNIVGHAAKVTKEYYKLLDEKYEVSIMASPCIINQLKENHKRTMIELPYDIVIDIPFTLLRRISDKLKILTNIYRCIYRSDGKKLFFYQTDFFFFLFIYFFYKKGKKKVYCLVYHQNFTAGTLEKALKYIYSHALKKIDGVIYTQKNQKIAHSNSLWIPDYIYDENYYRKYNKKQKLEKVVCLGTMNRYKELEKLVEVFKEIDIILEIFGRFDDKERYYRLVEAKSDNIIIEDCILSEETYYAKLGEAKYSILPYNMQQYISRTSGVLLESIYVGSIPIAPKLLLEQNELWGYGYETLDELKKLRWNVCRDDDVFIERILNENNQNKIKEKLQSFFMK